MTEIEDIAIELPCEYCNATPGHWCRTKSGRAATWLHSARSWPVQQAWGVGYEEAEKWRKEELQRRTEALRQEMRLHLIDQETVEKIVGKVMSPRRFW